MTAWWNTDDHIAGSSHCFTKHCNKVLEDLLVYLFYLPTKALTAWQWLTWQKLMFRTAVFRGRYLAIFCEHSYCQAGQSVHEHWPCIMAKNDLLDYLLRTHWSPSGHTKMYLLRCGNNSVTSTIDGIWPRDETLMTTLPAVPTASRSIATRSSKIC